MSTLLEKLKFLENDKNCLIIDAPEGFIEALKAPFNFDSEVLSLQKGKKYTYVLGFVKNIQSLEFLFPRVLKVIDEESILWLAYPKKTSKIKTDLSRDRGWDIVDAFKYRPVSLVSLSDTWSAFRLKPKAKVNARQKINIPEIDYDKKIVNPPNDVVRALKKENLEKAFEALSYTHKKEHVEAIVIAKKPDTRARRINKMIQMLSGKK